MCSPKWFGKRYPCIQDLEAFAHSLGIAVGYADIPIGLYFSSIDGVPAIVVPSNVGLLEMVWTLAHELGHAMHHAGPKGERCHGKEESQASLWAARALIPESRVKIHGNASLDAFIGALSAHYEDIPLEDCPARRLAAQIAKIRLRAVQEVA